MIWLSYDGTRYDGWQKQGNIDGTIQRRLEEILKRLDETPIEVRGSGRADVGVHALARAVDLRLSQGMAPRDVMEYLNRYLPEDTGVWETEEVPERFRNHLNAAGKTCRYQIEMGSKKDVFQRRYYYGLGLELDVGAMEQTANPPTGIWDLKSFCGNRKMEKSTVYMLESVQFECIGDTKFHISLTEGGFLQQMVRTLTGTLIGVGLGGRQPGDIGRILEVKDRQKAGFTAPSQGLSPEKVEYGGLE